MQYTLIGDKSKEITKFDFRKILRNVHGQLKFFQIIFDMLIIFISPMRDGQTILLTPLSQMDCILPLLFYQKFYY